MDVLSLIFIGYMTMYVNVMQIAEIPFCIKMACVIVIRKFTISTTL